MLCIYYSARKKRKKKILPFVSWMDLKVIMLSELVSQTEKRQILYDYTYMFNLKKIKKNLSDVENRLVVARVKGWANWVKIVKTIRMCSYKIISPVVNNIVLYV